MPNRSAGRRAPPIPLHAPSCHRVRTTAKRNTLRCHCQCGQWLTTVARQRPALKQCMNELELMLAGAKTRGNERGNEKCVQQQFFFFFFFVLRAKREALVHATFNSVTNTNTIRRFQTEAQYTDLAIPKKFRHQLAGHACFMF